MNCLDSTDRDAVLREPFEVIRDAPHQLTQRVKTLTDAGNERALAVQGQPSQNDNLVLCLPLTRVDIKL